MGSWSRFYQDDTATCLTIDTVAMPAPILTKGDMCLINGGSVTGASTAVDVGGNVYVLGPPANTSNRSPTVASGWTTSTDSLTSNGLYATNSISSGASGATLNESTYGFTTATVPATAKILGITVYVERHASVVSKVKDVSVRLQKTAGVVGSNYADTSTYYDTADGTQT